MYDFKFFIALLFLINNFSFSFFDLCENAYDEPLTINYFQNNKIVTIGSILLAGILIFQPININKIFKII